MFVRRVPETMPPAERGRAGSLSPEATPPSANFGANFDASFDAILSPNRSLPRRGFQIVMATIIGANILVGGYFYSIGAWPVLGFCGLDVFLVWLAFQLSYRQGRLQERVRVAPGEMRVWRVSPSGQEWRWRIEPFWARVVIDNPGRHEAQVRVVSKGRSLVLGAFMSPPERVAFGKALADAISRARNGAVV